MQILVVGAGVVGLAIARAAALAGHEVIVAEAASAIGAGVWGGVMTRRCRAQNPVEDGELVTTGADLMAS